MHELFSYSLKNLADLEGDNITLEAFNSDVYWAIGTTTRIPAKFYSTFVPMVILDTEEWITKKKRTVLRYGKFSFYLGQRLRISDKSLEDVLSSSSADYSILGGSETN